MLPDSWGVLVWAECHSGAPSICVTSGLLSLSTLQFGVQLYKNYQQTLCRHLCPPCGGSPPSVSVTGCCGKGRGAPRPHARDTEVPSDPSPVLSNLQRSVSDNTLVAMDFSGHAGRVIENPREALSAALEEAQAWRVRGLHSAACLYCSPSGLPWSGKRKARGEGRHPAAERGSLFLRGW